MKKDDKNKTEITRRKILPLIGGGLLLPFFGSAKTVEKLVSDDDGEYQILLTKEGKAVKVRTTAVKDSKIVDKQLSNTSLLNWLKKNNKDT
jgi:hypothetical protein